MKFLRYWYHRLWKTGPHHRSWVVTYPDGMHTYALRRREAEELRKLYGGRIDYCRDEYGNL